MTVVYYFLRVSKDIFALSLLLIIRPAFFGTLLSSSTFSLILAYCLISSANIRLSNFSSDLLISLLLQLNFLNISSKTKPNNFGDKASLHVTAIQRRILPDSRVILI